MSKIAREAPYSLQILQTCISFQAFSHKKRQSAFTLRFLKYLSQTLLPFSAFPFRINSLFFRNSCYISAAKSEPPLDGGKDTKACNILLYSGNHLDFCSPHLVNLYLQGLFTISSAVRAIAFLSWYLFPGIWNICNAIYTFSPYSFQDKFAAVWLVWLSSCCGNNGLLMYESWVPAFLSMYPGPRFQSLNILSCHVAFLYFIFY